MVDPIMDQVIALRLHELRRYSLSKPCPVREAQQKARRGYDTLQHSIIHRRTWALRHRSIGREAYVGFEGSERGPFERI